MYTNYLIRALSFLCCLLMCLEMGCTRDADNQQLNVLFVAVDDMNNDLACFGNAQVSSPHIDRLAARGMTFRNAYCQFPLCSPSRASILTGLRPDSTRVFDLTYHFRQGLPDAVTLPQMFMNNGYYVARIGKLFHYGNPGDIGTNGLDDKASWMERINPAGRDKTALEDDVINYTPDRRGLGASMAYYADSVGIDVEHTDGMVATEAVQMLANRREEPFFIAVGFYKPHCPWITPSKYFDEYDLHDVKLPTLPAGTQDDYPELALASTRPWPYLGLTPEQAEECKRAYFASISFVDAQIGRILHAVDSLGLADNTIIVFWSDHGYHLGEHGLWFKQSLFEESAKCPLIISVPGSGTSGTTCRRPVELLDIYPTLAELTGLTAPDYLQGFSLVPLLENPGSIWEHPAFTQVERNNNMPGHSVRTEKWRYTQWAYGREGEELYDEVNDPHELRNLAGDPALAQVVTHLRGLLQEVHPDPVSGGVAAPDVRERFSD